jgi:cytochrome c-type biogenesis protein
MRREKIALPAGVPSAEARARMEDLRDGLEGRYDFTLPTLEGPPRRLQAERGKVVVLNVWATWCGVCREEIPVLRKVYESLRGSGVEVFAITDESAAAVRGYGAKNPLGIPVLLDEKGSVFEHYGVVGRPQTVVLDRWGGIASRLDGPQREEEVRRAVGRAMR